MLLSRLIDFLIFPVLAVDIYVWGERQDWQLADVGLLELFPLLGLIAFSTMWWHFFTAFVRRLKPELTKHEGLHLASAYWVFASFMLHPTLLLLWGLQNQLGGLIDIYRMYVGPEQMVYVYLGLLALAGFLLFDLARVFSRQPIFQRHKGLITAVSDIAFVLILIHSLQLGQHLQAGWFRTYWQILGLSGIGFILYRYYFNLTRSETDEESPDN